MDNFMLVFDAGGVQKWINPQECYILPHKPVKHSKTVDHSATNTYVSRRDGTQTTENLIITPTGKYLLETRSKDTANIEQIDQQNAAMWLALNDYMEFIDNDPNLKEALEKSKLH